MLGQRSHVISSLLTIILIQNVSQAQEVDPAEAPAPPAEAEVAEETEAEEPAVAPPAEVDTTAEAAAPEAEPAPEPPAAEEQPAPAAPPPEPVEADAPSLLPLKVGTHTFSRWEIRANYDELGVSRARFQEGDATFFRARLSLETNPLKLSEHLEGLVNITPQASGVWGTSGLGGTIGEANAGLYEGYFLLRGKYVEGKVGRFAMNYGDALTIGNLDWHQSGRAFDGVHVRTKPGKGTVDFFVTQTTEGHPLQPDFLAGDTYFFGAYAMLGPLLTEGFDLDVYALGLSNAAADLDDGTGTGTLYHRDAATLATLGARVKQRISILDYRLEGGIQVGKTPGGPPAGDARDTVAFQVDGDVGVSPIPVLRIYAGGGIASGDDPTTADKMEGYNELFPTGHKFLGLMDIIGARTNVATARLGAGVNFTPSTILQVDGHLFARVEDGGLGRVPDSDSLAGFEIDTDLVQKLGKWAYVRGLYGIFIPGSGHYASDIAAHYGELQAGLKF